MTIDYDLLKRLSEAPGVPSREERIRKITVEALRPLADSLQVDRLGNAVALKRGGGAGGARRKVMIAAHMDEIGFLVRHVDKNGFLSLQPVGGFDPRSLFAQRVIVHASRGPALRGVLMPSASKPPHLMAGEQPKPPKVEEFFVDVGLPGEQVKEVVELGDMVTMDRTVERAGNTIIGKAMDDRVGVFVMIEALRAVRSHDVDILAVATVQEEVGLRGATTAAFGVDPDVGIALDVTLAVDVPGSKEQDRVSQLGKGVGIKIMDSSQVCDPRLVAHFRDIARRENIPFQMEILPRGGTDGGAIQRTRAGVPSITLSIPARYVHTVNEMVSETDVEAAITLLARYLEVAHAFDYAHTMD
ncbi:MAG: M42 family metallopeptidase [Chloroflexi bacterium]|nr:M42 family metallopeptidase [Chloroflexota bacterium]